MMTKRILVPMSETDPSAAVSLVRSVARDQGSTVRLLRVLPALIKRLDLPEAAKEPVVVARHKSLPCIRIATEQRKILSRSELDHCIR